ncbi:MAG: TonB-dependent receptor plug domain-containing protein [Bacteroidales bacterium]|nr:TonB-dependent receptor plug domain-containing protein [Bacteroidales bacterium]
MKRLSGILIAALPLANFCMAADGGLAELYSGPEAGYFTSGRNYVVSSAVEGSVRMQDTLEASSIVARIDPRENRTQTGLVRISDRRLREMPALAGSPDVIKTLQTMAGVALGMELFSGLYVRGGIGGDNLYLLDGAPLYQVSHMAGLFSSFNTDIVSGVDFYKSGFPARYGSRLSSVVDVSLADGSFREWHGGASLGLIDGRVHLSGPLRKGQTSIIIGARRSWMDLLTAPMVRLVNLKRKKDGEAGTVDENYIFYDANVKIVHRLSAGNTLYFTCYRGRDRFGVSLEEPSSLMGAAAAWGNDLAALRLEKRVGERLLGNIMLYYTRSVSDLGYKINSEPEEHLREESLFEGQKEEGASVVDEMSFMSAFDYTVSPSNHLRFGHSFGLHGYFPENKMVINSEAESFEENIKVKLHSFEGVLYAEDELLILPRMWANVGLRLTLFAGSGVSHLFVDTRLAIKWQLGRSTSLRASCSLMNQCSHQLATTYIDLPTNLWMPATSRIAPMRSAQLSMGLCSTLFHTLKVSAEGYFKSMEGITEYCGQSALYPPVREWEDFYMNGIGRCFGIESELEFENDCLYAAGSYTLSWNQRKFAGLYPAWYPERCDNRHRISLSFTGRISKKVDIHLLWLFHSGNRFSYSGMSADFGDYTIPVYDYPNNASLPPYHRMDLGMNFKKRLRNGLLRTLNISIYNLYNRKNALFATIQNTSGEERRSSKGSAIALVPILPSLSYSLNF